MLYQIAASLEVTRALIAFGLLFWKLPRWLVVLLTGVGGALL